MGCFAEVKAKPLVDTDKIRYVLMFWYQPNMTPDNSMVVGKEQTDGKRVLRQERIRRLIDSLTDDDRLEGRGGEGENQGENADQEQSSQGESEPQALMVLPEQARDMAQPSVLEHRMPHIMQEETHA